MRRAGALVRGTRAVQQCPPPLEDSRRPAILPARWPACLAGEATGSVESTPAHTLPESMLSAALGTSCRAASGPGPFPARCSQSWGRRALECGWPRARLSPFGVLVPCIAFPRPRRVSLPPPSRLGTEAWMSSPLPEARSKAGWPEAWRCGCLPGGPARCARHAHGPRAVSSLGGRGCVSTRPLAHILAVTHKALVS